jgi:hypothetical protein
MYGPTAGQDRKWLLDLYKRIDDIGAVVVGNAHRGPLNLLHEASEIVARAGDADDAKRRALPKIALFELRDRYVEAAAQLVFQTAQHLALVFERMRALNAELEGERGNGHVQMLMHRRKQERRTNNRIAQKMRSSLDESKLDVIPTARYERMFSSVRE